MSDPFDLGSVGEPESDQAASPTYLDGLNEEQRVAVEATDGPLLVLAGAGTGKTRVLTARLANILLSRKAWPSQVLAVTFTNKAAREMRERLETLLGGEVEGLWIGTFHAMATRILRRHAELVGLKPDFTILDADDQIRLLKQILEAANIDEKRWPARALSAVIERWKNAGLTPDKVTSGHPLDNGFANGKAAALYTAYQARLTTLNAADFGDLLLHCLTIFAGHPDVLKDYQDRFRYILVDEYQDTNVAQYLWLRLLAQTRRNICCVGDDDQSIYGWRGAEVGNILRFEKDFPGATVVRLERNYRSTPHILGAASGVIAHNQGRLGKTLWTDLNDGERVIVREVWDGDAEARMVGDDVEAAQIKGDRLDDIAILVRASFQTRAFEERFITLGVPYRVIGGPRFYERREIRDALAYIRVVVSPEDDLAFERIINVPKRGIGEATVRTIHATARASDMPMTAAAQALCETDELRARSRNALQHLLNDFARWRGLVPTMNHTELVEIILDESGYTSMWQQDKSADAPGRLENLKELIQALEDFDNLGGFLEHVGLVMDNAADASGDMVNLMTLHGAKGLEFDTVFLPGWEEGLFPHQRALDEGGVTALEEERRLAYVGLTRARRKAIISHAQSRRIFDRWVAGAPSRFIEELPEDHVEAENQTGLSSGGWGGYTGTPAWLRPSGGRQAEEAGGHWDAAPASGQAFDHGERIFHQKFGYGRITDIDGDKLHIAFEKAGDKTVLASFVEPAHERP